VRWARGREERPAGLSKEKLAEESPEMEALTGGQNRRKKRSKSNACAGAKAKEKKEKKERKEEPKRPPRRAEIGFFAEKLKSR